MKEYKICINNVYDLEKYVGFLERFTFRGHVQIPGSPAIDAQDIITLFSYCPNKVIQLFIDSGIQEEALSMQEYLTDARLLKSV